MNSKNNILFLYDFAINHTNRGCQALTYGSISFIKKIIKDADKLEWIVPGYCFRHRKDEIFNVEVDGEIVAIKRRYYFLPEIIISTFFYRLFKKSLFKTSFAKDLERLEYVTNISGGDGFSDIYSPLTFLILTWPSLISVFLRKKLIVMPQTIGPFTNKFVKKAAHYILKGAHKVYVRDLVYAKMLEKLGVDYTFNYDVSYYMNPKSVNYEVKKNSIGINVSGLTYYNNYRNLAGKFEYYKELIIRLINSFQTKGIPVYLVPHTYNYHVPEINSDDLQASKDIYNSLQNKDNIFVLDEDLNAPELKYIISQFDFFIGTRMHANFAAIFTKTPVFGLAYSYKFSGSFDLYGLNNNYSSVIDISKEHIEQIIQKIHSVYDDRSSMKFLVD